MTSKDAFSFMMTKKKRDKDAPDDDDGPSQKQRGGGRGPAVEKRGISVERAPSMVRGPLPPRWKGGPPP